MQTNKLRELADEDLMRLYQQGDFLAFEVLYKRHSGRVYEYLKRKSSPETAKDLMQEVFEKLHKARGKYDSQYPFLPWLFTISRNVFLDYYKKAETKITHAASGDEKLLAKLSVTEPLLADGEMRQNLAALSEPQRRAIELRYLQDWSFEQIAADLETSQENVRQLISRGLKKVKQLLAKNGEPHDS